MTRRDRYGEPIDEDDDDLVEPYGRRAFRDELARLRATAAATTSTPSQMEEPMTGPADVPADPSSRANMAAKVDRWWRDLPLTTRLRVCVEFEAGRAIGVLGYDEATAPNRDGRPPV